jgi:hypothetical protein
MFLVQSSDYFVPTLLAYNSSNVVIWVVSFMSFDVVNCISIGVKSSSKLVYVITKDHTPCTY